MTATPTVPAFRTAWIIDEAGTVSESYQLWCRLCGQTYEGSLNSTCPFCGRALYVLVEDRGDGVYVYKRADR